MISSTSSLGGSISRNFGSETSVNVTSQGKSSANWNERNADNPRYNPTIGMKFLSLRVDVLEQQFAVPGEALVLPVPDPDFRRPGQTEEATPDWVEEQPAPEPASQPTTQPTQ